VVKGERRLSTQNEKPFPSNASENIYKKPREAIVMPLQAADKPVMTHKQDRKIKSSIRICPLTTATVAPSFSL